LVRQSTIPTRASFMMPSIILKSDDAHPSVHPARRRSSSLLYGTARPGYDTLGNPPRSSRLAGAGAHLR